MTKNKASVSINKQKEMVTKKISLDLPAEMLEKIIQITRDDEIYEDYSDFIMHAITNMLEKYK